MQYLTEIWRDYSEKEQEWYRNRFKILRKHTKRLHKSDNSGIHNVLIRRIGPEWYQELSPNQLETVDRFQQCIWRDLIEGTVVNCQENLIELGVVPKFSKKYLRLALNDCNQCPIEFLLILQQLINPKRIDYTLNDRLLLSSVVHLAMRDTLRELHVRIPSPPRKPPRKIRDVNKKRKKVNYESPYLEISTFKPLSRPKGVYANKHIQYPESPYFDYLKILKDNPCSVEDLNLIEIQILSELEKAQCFYETLFDYEPIPKLLKPCVYSNAELELTDEIIANTPESVHSQEEDLGEAPETEASVEMPEESTEVVENPNCHCLEKYQELKENEIISKRYDLVDKLETSTDKYIIGGIVDTPNGPECLITGCVPKKSPPVCDCLEKYFRKIKENEKRQKLVEKLEQNDKKFIIGGIVDTPQGPECLINGCIPKKVPPRCCCMRIYEDYLKEHSNCMKLYEDYLNEINECINELLDQEQALVAQNQCTIEKLVESRDTSFDYFPLADTCSYYDPDEWIQDQDKVENIAEAATQPSENVEYPINVSNDTALNTQNLDTAPTNTDVSPEGSAEERNDERLEQDTEQPVQIQIDPHSTVFKRFFIYKKLPNNPKQQISLIKAALKSMADDGYPLARLPDAYKLPHFKLWMQMRCGKFWTQQDRRNYLQKNIQFWNHTEKCRSDVPMLKLPISQKRAKELTWRQADYCRKIVNDAKNLYCKRLKEAIIDLGREFYPTTFSYEFPSKVFRNCYFTYIPTREMDVFGKFVWDLSEIKDFSKRKIWQ